MMVSQGLTSYAIFTYKCNIYDGLDTVQQLAIVLDVTILLIIYYLEHQELQTLTVLIIHHLHGQIWFII